MRSLTQGSPSGGTEAFPKPGTVLVGAPGSGWSCPGCAEEEEERAAGLFLAKPCSAWSLEYAASYFKGARALGRPRSAPVPVGKEQRPGGVEPVRRS